MTAANRLVADASVAIKWYVPESLATEAAAILTSGRDLLAPDILVPECGNVLWKKVRAGELSDEEARTILRALISSPPLRLVSSTTLAEGAFYLATAYGRSMYHALYLALAVAEGCPLITADARFVNALSGSTLEPLIQLLS